MIFFGKKRKHRLPKFPPGTAETFHSLCTEVDESEVEILKTAVNKHFNKKQEVDNPYDNYNEKEALEILKACNFLFEVYPKYDDQRKKLIIGALRYAASTCDPFCDSTFASGMADDKQVINYVLEELDIHDQYLTVY